MTVLPPFDLAAFRTAFLDFIDPVRWPDAALARARQEAGCHISPIPGKRLDGVTRGLALDLMTAHLLVVGQGFGSGDAGSAGGNLQSATVDKVSVSVQAVPVKTQFQWWLAQTPYGQRLLALLKSRSAGGLYVGGVPTEREGFRKAGGVFVQGKGT